MDILINADDFGLNESKTAAIDAGIRAGIIKRASITTNGAAFAQAVALAREGGYMDRICFHLNLVEGKPLSEALARSSFVTGDGNLRELRNRERLLKGFHRSNILLLRAECEAQMRRFREAGFQSARIDSHKWCLFSIPAWKAIKPLLKQYGFEITRTPLGHRFDTASLVLRSYYKLVYSGIRKELQILDDWSGCGSELKQAASAGVLGEAAKVELYLHPELIDGIPMDGLWSYKRDKLPLDQVPKEAEKLGTLKAADCVKA